MPFESPESDDALLAAYRDGDPQAARLLIARLGPQVFRLARRLLNDFHEAEDVTQEAFLRLWQTAPAWPKGGPTPAAWLLRVTANLAIDRLRRRRQSIALHDLPDALPELADSAGDGVSALVAADRLSALEVALSQLPDRQRVAVVLRHLEGLSNAEIARHLGMSIEAVESLIARGKRRLIELLAAARPELGFER